MARIKITHKDPTLANTGLVYIKSEKAAKAHKKLKIVYRLLGLSVLINIGLLIKLIG